MHQVPTVLNLCMDSKSLAAAVAGAQKCGLITATVSCRRIHKKTPANVSTRSQGPGVLRRRNGHFSPIVLGVCLALWPMRKLSNVDAYTMEQVRRTDYATNCGLGFAGLHCSELITCKELDYCSGHGICQRGGYCMCDIGWEGATCKQSYCPSGCSGHGSCAATGGCVCDAGFTGMICDSFICLGGGNCTGHGACLHGGVCSCEKGYLGAACDVIDVVQICSNHGETLYSAVFMPVRR
jgi:hypothetical protein